MFCSRYRPTAQRITCVRKRPFDFYYWGWGGCKFKKKKTKKKKKKKKTGSNFGRKTYLGQSKFCCITILHIVIYNNKKTGPRRERKIISRPGNIFQPLPPPLKIHSFIYLSILGQFTSLLRSFSSYETSQSVGVVKTGEPREKKGKKKNPGISSSRTCLTAHNKHSGETIE